MKIVGGKKYVHVSAVNQFTPEEQKRVAKAYRRILKGAMDGPNIKVIVLSKDAVEFVECPDWDIYYEPIVFERYVVTGRKVEYRQSDRNKVYHKRHLFVNPDYFGFDVEEDKKRGELIDSLNLDKTRIGNEEYWHKIMKKYGLPER